MAGDTFQPHFLLSELFPPSDGCDRGSAGAWLCPAPHLAEKGDKTRPRPGLLTPGQGYVLLPLPSHPRG